MRWGVYAGGAIFDTHTGARVPQFFHYMMAANTSTVAQLTLPGAANLSHTVGHTKPVDEQGRIGGSAQLSVSLIYGAVPIVQTYQLGVTDAGGRNWHASLVSPQTLASFVTAPNNGSSNLNVTCSGALAQRRATSGNVSAAGIVAGGANRDVMISSYVLRAGTAGVTGSFTAKP